MSNVVPLRPGTDADAILASDAPEYEAYQAARLALLKAWVAWLRTQPNSHRAAAEERATADMMWACRMNEGPNP